MKINPVLAFLIISGALVGGYYVYESKNSQLDILKPSTSQGVVSQPRIQNLPRTQTTQIKNTTTQSSYKKIGDTFTLWGLQYQILSAVNKGSTYNSSKSSQGKFIEVKIKAENVDKKELGVNKIILIDSSGRQFSQNDVNSISFSEEYYGYGLQYADYMGIPSGFSEKFIAVFEVPKNSSGLRLAFPSSTGQLAIQVDLGM